MDRLFRITKVNCTNIRRKGNKATRVLLKVKHNNDKDITTQQSIPGPTPNWEQLNIEFILKSDSNKIIIQLIHERAIPIGKLVHDSNPIGQLGIQHLGDIEFQPELTPGEHDVTFTLLNTCTPNSSTIKITYHISPLSSNQNSYLPPTPFSPQHLPNSPNVPTHSPYHHPQQPQNYPQQYQQPNQQPQQQPPNANANANGAFPNYPNVPPPSPYSQHPPNSPNAPPHSPYPQHQNYPQQYQQPNQPHPNQQYQPNQQPPPNASYLPQMPFPNSPPNNNGNLQNYPNHPPLSPIKGGGENIKEVVGSISASQGFYINCNEIKFQSKIAKGGFGEVWKGEWSATPVAIKKILPHIISDKDIDLFAKEILLMSKLRHPNIVQFLGVCTQPEFCLLIQFMEKGSLFHVIRDDPNLTWKIKIGFIRNITSGMVYLHSHNIVHRDIKSLNILVDGNYQAAITDFGLTKYKKEQEMLTTRCGSPAWTAPEVLRGKPYDEKADVYSYGIVLWEILANSPPYPGIDSGVVIQKVAFDPHNLFRPPIPQCPYPLLVDLMIQCWSDNPVNRPSFPQIWEILSTTNFNY